jgi:hypothetical protein
MKGLQALSDFIHERGVQISERRLVFVVPPDIFGDFKKQSLKTAAGKDAERPNDLFSQFSQWVVQFPLSYPWSNGVGVVDAAGVDEAAQRAAGDDAAQS